MSRNRAPGTDWERPSAATDPEILTDEWDQLPGDGELAWLGAILMVLSAGCSVWLYYRATRFVIDVMR